MGETDFLTSPFQCLRPLPVWSGSAFGSVYRDRKVFRILKESGDWRWPRASGVMRWVEYRYCLISLSDVVLSMVYNNTNAYSSIFIGLRKNIPGVAKEVLYKTRGII